MRKYGKTKQHSFKHRKTNLVTYKMPVDIPVYGWINTLKGAAITIDIYETQQY